MAETRATRPDLMAVLEERGYRATAPRRSVVNLLDQKKEVGFSVEEICHELPDVGRATVYRTIKILLEAGVVCKLALPDGAPKYSLARFDHHHHTICTRCGTVGDFRDATIERLMRTIGSEISGEIVGHRVEFFIICQNCRKGARG